jgi:ribosomal protein S18 acetylase RimI-like enzyme
VNADSVPDPIVRLDPADWPALAPFILRHNRLPDGQPRCLHAHQGDTIGEHAQELRALRADEAAFWTASRAGRMQGLIGCAFDPLLRRAWLRGPLTTEGAPDELAVSLLLALEGGLPALDCFDAFPSETDPSLNRLFPSAGYERQGVHRVLEAPLAPSPDDSAMRPSGVLRAEAVGLAALLALHRDMFPTSYLKDSDFEAAIQAADRCLLACTIDGRCVGYLHAKDEPGQQEIYIDYVGVAAEARGQGIGRALLLAALAWGWDLGRTRASLTVREDRASALTLYQRLGFTQVSAGVHWRKHRGDEAPQPTV